MQRKILFPRHIHNNYPDNVGVNKLNINKIALNFQTGWGIAYDHEKKETKFITL